MIFLTHQGYTVKDLQFWRIIGSLGLGSIFIFSAMYAVQPLLPLFTKEFDVSVSYASMTISMTTIGMILGLIVLGFFSDRNGRTFYMKISLIGTVLPFLLMPMTDSFVLFLTEITSNTATATMMFPIMASFAAAIGVHPYGLMIAAGVAASCAFMLPVATPPNAVVFGSGYLKITDMVKAGFWINVSCIFFITAAIYFLLPMVWGIDLHVFPDALR